MDGQQLRQRYFHLIDDGKNDQEWIERVKRKIADMDAAELRQRINKIEWLNAPLTPEMQEEQDKMVNDSGFMSGYAVDPDVASDYLPE